MAEKTMTKKSPSRCEGCDRKLTAKQKKIVKAIGADKALCSRCSGKGKFPPEFSSVKKRFTKALRRLRD